MVKCSLRAGWGFWTVVAVLAFYLGVTPAVEADSTDAPVDLYDVARVLSADEEEEVYEAFRKVPPSGGVMIFLVPEGTVARSAAEREAYLAREVGLGIVPPPKGATVVGIAPDVPWAYVRAVGISATESKALAESLVEASNKKYVDGLKRAADVLEKQVPAGLADKRLDRALEKEVAASDSAGSGSNVYPSRKAAGPPPRPVAPPPQPEHRVPSRSTDAPRPDGIGATWSAVLALPGVAAVAVVGGFLVWRHRR